VCKDDLVVEIEPYAVVIVTHDHAETLAACLAAVEGLEPPPARLVVVDNASADGSAEIAEKRPGDLATTIVREEHHHRRFRRGEVPNAIPFSSSHA